MKMTTNMKTNEDELKKEDDLKICPPTQQQCCLPPSKYNNTWIFLTTSHFDSHTTNDVKLEKLSGVQTRNRIPHDEYNKSSIGHAHAYIFMQRRLV